MKDFFDIMDLKDEYDVVIIGGGPAGCIASVYAARDELSTLTLEKSGPGGQMGITAIVENHPGFPDTVEGFELSEKYHAHAKKYGAHFKNGNVTKINLLGVLKHVYIEKRDKPIVAKTIIIATGSVPRKLGIDGENKFFGRGVSTCATCDGGFYKDKVVLAVGGGNTALEESDYLTRFASKVYIVHRRDEFRASKIAQRLVEKNPKIELVLSSVLTSINGTGSVESVDVKNLKNDTIKNIKTDGVFIFAGQIPCTEVFKNIVDLDQEGYILSGEDTRTNIAGIFAAGDVRKKDIRQIATAVGDGVVAAKHAAKYLQELSAE